MAAVHSAVPRSARTTRWQAAPRSAACGGVRAARRGLFAASFLVAAAIHSAAAAAASPLLRLCRPALCPSPRPHLARAHHNHQRGRLVEHVHRHEERDSQHRRAEHDHHKDAPPVEVVLPDAHLAPVLAAVVVQALRRECERREHQVDEELPHRPVAPRPGGHKDEQVEEQQAHDEGVRPVDGVCKGQQLRLGLHKGRLDAPVGLAERPRLCLAGRGKARNKVVEGLATQHDRDVGVPLADAPSGVFGEETPQALQQRAQAQRASRCCVLSSVFHTTCGGVHGRRGAKASGALGPLDRRIVNELLVQLGALARGHSWLCGARPRSSGAARSAVVAEAPPAWRRGARARCCCCCDVSAFRRDTEGGKAGR
mmetsp:Transcript_9350/g.29155  ORF Transcript_9350/g.29155 Transcript_9350/m.29155 type:complete len:369 (-) Transcript_9350:15-1121(-)